MALTMKARLADAKVTQRWMLDQLHKRGFAKLYETTLSDINRGRSTTTYSVSVLEEEERILAEVASNGV